MSIIVQLTSNSCRKVMEQSQIPIVVDFWASWCGPCKMVSPILEKLSDEFDGRVKFAKLNVEREEDIADEYCIRSIPALIVFKDGQRVAKTTGLQSIAAYRRFIVRCLEGKGAG